MLKTNSNQFGKLSLAILLSVSFASCKKDKPATTAVITDPANNTPVEVVKVADPEVAKTMGFFLNDWQPKTFIAPGFTEVSIPASVSSTVTIDASSVVTKIPLSEFGNNAVWWMGDLPQQTVTDVKNLHPHIIRFPGGNSANNYFWNAEQDKAPADVPVNQLDKDGLSIKPGYNYGKTNHDWELSLDKYYNMLQQTGNQGIISVNYSYARYGTGQNPVTTAAHLAADWVRYDKGRTKYWEIGNENYGNWQPGYRIDVSKNKDGQPEIITGDLYGRHVKVFVDSMKKAAADIGTTIYVGAVAHELPSPEPWQTTTTKTWNAGVMKSSENKADFYVVHNYFTNSENLKSDAILSAAATMPTTMMNFVTQELQQNGATIKPIAFDEWNMFAKDAMQQVSNVSGLFAVMVLGETIKNKYGMAARWDMLNGWDNGDDHGMFSPGNEPGVPKWNPRPSFYYMYYLQKTLGDRMVPSTVTGNSSLKTYASTYSSGETNVAVVNTSATAQTFDIKFKNFNAGNRYYWYTLEGGSDNGEFSRKVLVNGSAPAIDAGGLSDYSTLKARSAVTANGIKLTVPARGAVFVIVDKK